MSECLFCRIAAGEMGTEFVYEDETVVAFSDINPRADVHVLVVPRHHVETLMGVDCSGADPGALIRGVQATADALGLAEKGFKLLANVGEGGGQIVPHLHFHIMAGKVRGLPV